MHNVNSILFPSVLPPTIGGRAHFLCPNGKTGAAFALRKGFGRLYAQAEGVTFVGYVQFDRKKIKIMEVIIE